MKPIFLVVSLIVALGCNRTANQLPVSQLSDGGATAGQDAAASSDTPTPDAKQKPTAPENDQLVDYWVYKAAIEGDIILIGHVVDSKKLQVVDSPVAGVQYVLNRVDATWQIDEALLGGAKVVGTTFTERFIEKGCYEPTFDANYKYDKDNYHARCFDDNFGHDVLNGAPFVVIFGSPAAVHFIKVYAFGPSGVQALSSKGNTASVDDLKAIISQWQ